MGDDGMISVFNPPDKIELKPCPFCGGTDIKYSTKTCGIGRKTMYHASYYCNNCHCYGARVLSNKVDKDNYNGRREVESSERLRKAAEEAWNERTNLTVEKVKI